MAYRAKNPRFPSDREEELLELIRTFGSFEDLKTLAEYFDTSHLAIASFLKTNRALKAKAEYKPGTKEAIAKHLGVLGREPSAAEEWGLSTERQLGAEGYCDGLDVVEPYPEGLYLDHKRVLNERRNNDQSDDE